MKTLISTLVMALSFASLASAKTVSCQSLEIVEGWNAGTTRDYVYFTADIKSNAELSNAVITGAFVAHTDSSVADITKAPKSPYYAAYSNFSSLEDAWCWYNPFLPKFMADLDAGKEFKGFIGRVCESGNRENIAVQCVIK
ncbi:hypothetical protein [Bdellovibrio sp. HCB209]|uniref:hypothetical protein n=1 Tax=Bdellovibrio sp. HCB209 TaxID=3394354 RepID=UPI0039B49AAB